MILTLDCFFLQRMTLSENALICSQCYHFLKNIENFKAKCIDVQKKLLHNNIHLNNTSQSNNDITSNSAYSSKGINTDSKISHYFESVGPSVLNRPKESPPTSILKNLQHSSIMNSTYPLPKKVKTQKNQTIEVIEINDNEVELKIAEESESEDDEDDIFIEESDDEVIIKEEIKEDNPRYVSFTIK